MALSWSLDKLGPLALTAEDCGLILEAIAGPDPKDPTTIPTAFRQRRIRDRRFRLATPRGVTEGLDEAVAENFTQSLTILGKTAAIEEVEFPNLPFETITRTILNAESASAFEEFIEEGKLSELTAPEDRFSAYARTAVLAKDYLRALRLRIIMAKALDEMLSTYDAIVAPTYKSTATPIGQQFRHPTERVTGDITGAAGNGAGLPSISVPNGFTRSGLPTGIQFMGKAGDENAVLSIACRFQSLTDWHKQHPSGLT